jgi:hypothetical protein
MPYKLRKAPNRDLYWVVTIETGKKHSRLPISLDKAKAQMRILESTVVGNGIFDKISNEFVNPDSYLRQAVGKVTNEFVNPESLLRSRIEDVFTGIRKNLPPSSRKVMEKYGSWTIVDAKLRRHPIGSVINQALNFVTLGQWDKAKAIANYDKLFHLALIITVQSGSETHELMVEKNEVIYIGNVKDASMSPDYLPVRLPSVSLAEFIAKAAESKGENFFLYDAFHNNCQDFVSSLLEANGSMTSEAKKFIKQDTVALLRNVPGYTADVAKAITNLGALINKAMEGRGLAISTLFEIL